MAEGVSAEQARDQLRDMLRAPEATRSRFSWFLDPLLRWSGWQLAIQDEALTALLEAVKHDGQGRDHLAAAVDELGENLRNARRAVSTSAEAPRAELRWLLRVADWLVRVRPRLEQDERGLERFANGLERCDLLRPLRSADGGGGASVAAVDSILRVARRESQLLGRRRRLLEAARRALLDTAAALDLEPAGLEARRSSIAAEIVNLNRAERAGVRAEVRLDFQIQRARGSQDWPRLGALLATQSYVAAFDAIGEQARRAADRLGPSSAEVVTGGAFSPDVLEAIARGYERGRQKIRRQLVQTTLGGASFLRQFQRYLAPEEMSKTLTMGMGADGFFEVGGTLSATREEAFTDSPELVSFPTQELRLVPSGRPSDVAAAVFSDPRLVLYELAVGRLLSRRYVRTTRARGDRHLHRAQARIYLLDGSGSMLGSRARMRDAVIVAELATLVSRLQRRDRRIRSTVYYRYFQSKATATRRVSTAPEALQAIEDIVSTVHFGGTDIEGALLDSFAQVFEARRHDPELSDAQIVLVTDGMAPVNQERILAARSALGDLPVAISVISLGHENPELGRLCHAQRRAGELAFYHHISDVDLERWRDGSPLAGLSFPEVAEAAGGPEAFEELSGLLDDLEAMRAGRHDESASWWWDYERAVEELGLGEDLMSEAQRVRLASHLEQLERVERRFDAWFPACPANVASVAPARGSSDAEMLDEVVRALSVVLEVSQELSSSRVGRRADAIELLVHLLDDVDLLPAAYCDTLARYPSQTRAYIDALRGEPLRASPDEG